MGRPQEHNPDTSTWLIEGPNGPVGVIDEATLQRDAQRLYRECLAAHSAAPFVAFAKAAASPPYLAAVAGAIAYEWVDFIIVKAEPQFLTQHVVTLSALLLACRHYLPLRTTEEPEVSHV